jgi:hypothetical protein
MRHEFNPDDSGLYCSICQLPKGNWRHSSVLYAVRTRQGLYGPFRNSAEAADWASEAEHIGRRFQVIVLRHPGEATSGGM